MRVTIPLNTSGFAVDVNSILQSHYLLPLLQTRMDPAMGTFDSTLLPAPACHNSVPWQHILIPVLL